MIEAKHLGAATERGSSPGFMPCRDEPEHNPRSTAKHLGAATERGSSPGFMPCRDEPEHNSRSAAKRGRHRAHQKTLAAVPRALALAPDHEPTKVAYATLTGPNSTALDDLVGTVVAKRNTAAAAMADFIPFVAECLKARPSTAFVAERLEARAGAQRPRECERERKYIQRTQSHHSRSISTYTPGHNPHMDYGIPTAHQ